MDAVSSTQFKEKVESACKERWESEDDGNTFASLVLDGMDKSRRGDVWEIFVRRSFSVHHLGPDQPSIQDVFGRITAARIG